MATNATPMGLANACSDQILTASPAVTASAYTAGYVLGGPIQLIGAARNPGGACILESITVTDKGNQKPPLLFVFFSQSPTLANWADHATPTVGADRASIVGTVIYSTYTALGADNPQVAVGSAGGIGLLLQQASGSQIWVCVITTGTPTPASTSDYTFEFGVLQS